MYNYFKEKKQGKNLDSEKQMKQGIAYLKREIKIK